MGRVYLFADEAGNFDFRTRPGASDYFIVRTVRISDTALGYDLIELRRELAWQGVGLESCFHATADAQVVRDEVFRLLAGANFRADFTIVEKCHNPRRHPLHVHEPGELVPSHANWRFIHHLPEPAESIRRQRGQLRAYLEERLAKIETGTKEHDRLSDRIAAFK